MKNGKIELPKGILKSDLDYCGWKKMATRDRGNGYNENIQFELWLTTGMGWVIPTLAISGARRGTAYQRRTYAARISNGGLCSVGRGPHVLKTYTVYVKKSRANALKPFIDLWQSGERKSNEYRDRLSSRRMRSREARFYF